jgi:hypothetical protein
MLLTKTNTLFTIKLFFLICIGGGGVQTGSTRHIGHLLAYCTCPGRFEDGEFGGMNWQGKPKYSDKTCPGATLSTTNPTLPDPGSNPGRRGGKPATNRLSYGAAYNKTCHDQKVVSIIICCPERLDIKYTWMPSLIYQNVVNLVVEQNNTRTKLP